MASNNIHLLSYSPRGQKSQNQGVGRAALLLELLGRVCLLALSSCWRLLAVFGSRPLFHPENQQPNIPNLSEYHPPVLPLKSTLVIDYIESITAYSTASRGFPATAQASQPCSFPEVNLTSARLLP